MNLIKKVVSGLTLCALVLLHGCSPAKKELVVHYGAEYETSDYQIALSGLQTYQAISMKGLYISNATSGCAIY